jgi:hypothetical protein
MIVLE